MANKKKIINKECKYLIFVCEQVEDNTRILIGNKKKKIIGQISNWKDSEKYLKDAGEMTMYDYDDNTKLIKRMKQTEFYESCKIW